MIYWQMHYKDNGKMEKGLQKQQPSLVSRKLRAYVMMDITKYPLFSTAYLVYDAECSRLRILFTLLIKNLRQLIKNTH